MTQPTSLYLKMMNIMERVDSVYKGATVKITQTSSYNAVSHDDVASLLHPEFVKEKIWVKTSVKEASTEVQSVTKRSDRGDYTVNEYVSRVVVVVTYINAENPSEKEECEMAAYSIDSGDKGMGKALSMAVKYAHLKNFTLESTDEEEKREGHGYEEKPRQNQPQSTQQRSQPSSQGDGPKPSAKQLSYIKMLAEKAGVPMPTILSIADADKAIKDLTARTR